MLDLNCIESALTSTGWNKARVALLSQFIAGLLCLQTVSLTRLATVMPSPAKTGSNYRRLQRFLAEFTFEDASIARLLARIANVPQPWILALDRTDWKLGKAHLNVLMLSVVAPGSKMAFPLLWTALEKEAGRGKAGASNTDERIALIERFLAVFGRQSLAYLCADREFVGEQWVKWLRANNIAFRLRVKADTLLSDGNGELACADWMFRTLALGKEKYLSGRRTVFGQRDAVFVGCKRIGRRSEDDFLIVISSEEFRIDDYAYRWGIETMFGAFKSRGFNLEATHVVRPDRLSCLIGVVAIAYCWALAVGEWINETAPLKLKKHGRQPVSTVRRGLDMLRPLAILLCANYKKASELNARRFLSCT